MTLTDAETSISVNIFDLNENRLIHTFKENSIKNANPYISFPDPIIFKISKDTDNPMLAWYSWDSHSNNSHTKYMRIGVDAEPKTLLVSEKNDNHWPLFVSDRCIISSSSDSEDNKSFYWLTRFFDGTKPKTIGLDEFDSEIFSDLHPIENQSNTSVNIQGKYVFWTKRNNRNWMEQNICWAKLSEIFPDTQVADLEGQNE
ncbi:MAG: hypothetical protein R2883_05215 [Caldisericia bacterium]